MNGVALAALLEAGAIETSCVEIGEGAAGLRAASSGWVIVAWAARASALPAGLAGSGSEAAGGALLVSPTDAAGAAALRRHIPWLRPRLLGLATSAGTGDRLGIATPGHVAAFRANPGIAPVLAQQSARELGRTGRSFGDVVDAATFGVLASGWRDGYGADADHLKTIEDLDGGIRAGCTMFTSDPIDLVPRLPADAPASAIETAFAQVPWALLEDDRASFEARYPTRLDLDAGPLELSREALRSAAARFGAAVAHVTAMYRHVLGARGEGGFEFEVAVDEIDHPTTPVDHVYLATELGRLGVKWVSLAPRFVGEFEKGVDYVGDVAALSRDAATHAAIARAFGGYKVSIHSGSDKFSVYDELARVTRGAMHLKTSGTSYLAALSVIAETEPDLMLQIWRIAIRAYATARASYHVSADLAGLNVETDPARSELVGLVTTPRTREILHVTYGAVLYGDGRPENGLGPAVHAAVWKHRAQYWTDLEKHIGRHLSPFAGRATGATSEAHK